VVAGPDSAQGLRKYLVFLPLITFPPGRQTSVAGMALTPPKLSRLALLGYPGSADEAQSIADGYSSRLNRYEAFPCWSPGRSLALETPPAGLATFQASSDRLLIGVLP
jgi:hypothetical protein